MIGIESGRSERGVVTIYIAAPILDITRHIRHNFAVERENDCIQWNGSGTKTSLYLHFVLWRQIQMAIATVVHNVVNLLIAGCCPDP